MANMDNNLNTNKHLYEDNFGEDELNNLKPGMPQPGPQPQPQPQPTPQPAPDQQEKKNTRQQEKQRRQLEKQQQKQEKLRQKQAKRQQQQQLKKGKKGRKILTLLLVLLILAFAVFILPQVYSDLKGDDEEQGPSVLTSRELIETDIDNVYDVTKKMTKLKGKSDFTDYGAEPQTIRYRVTTVRDYKVAEGEIPFAERWTIDLGGLADGVNYVTLEYVFADSGDNQEFDYIIYNYNEESAEALGITDEDSDGDGLNDSFELDNAETDPYSKDTDADGVDDGDEDPDEDGLTNLEEQEYGTSAHAMDSDSEGLPDGEEIGRGTDPAKADTDGDSYSDADEIAMGTDPNDKSDPRKKETISYTESQSFDSGMEVEISMASTPDGVSSFRIYEIPESFTVSKANIEGMIGTGISIVMDGEPESAEVSITLDCDDYVDGENYYLYYFNETTNSGEYVEQQSQNGNVITATLEHFSKYFVSSIGKGDAGDPGTYGIDEVSDAGSEAYFDSYESYIAAMYPGKAVFSINVCSGNVDSSNPLNLYFDDEGNITEAKGHSWTSYYYAGSDPSLKVKTLDRRLSDDDVFGAIGYGGWVDQPENVFSMWDGSLKMPSGYRKLYHKGTRGNDGKITYQSETYDYTDTFHGENMSAAYISMPFVINSEELSKIAEFVNSYKRQYCLYFNNCTTFTRDVLSYAGISNSININAKDFENSLTDELLPYTFDTLLTFSGSPGQAAYSIQTAYPYEHVYVVEVTKEDGSSQLMFTSKMAQDCAVGSEVKESAWNFSFPDIGELLEKGISELLQQLLKQLEGLQYALIEWIEELLTNLINSFIMENCGY